MEKALDYVIRYGKRALVVGAILLLCWAAIEFGIL